ncbi:MAG: DNA recombination protein RmuC [Alistipes sp.]
MNTAWIILLIVLTLLSVVLAATTLSLRSEAARLQLEKERAEADLRTMSEQHTATQIAEAEARTKLAAVENRLTADKAEREKAEELMRAQFKNLAGEIFGEQSRHFRETNKEALDVLLKPFKDNISEFRERVEKIYSTENEQHGALRNELDNLMKLNIKITTETTNLTNALKGNSKVQGDWGEMILETILDSSNLIKGMHYDTQSNLKDSEGNNLRPDVILHLPDNKHIIVDY